MDKKNHTAYSLIAFFLLAVSCFAQSSATSNCNQSGTISSATVGVTYNNNGPVKCTAWILNWWTYGTGVSGTTASLTFSINVAPDNGAGTGTPGSFVVLNQASLTAGLNPQTVTAGSPGQGTMGFFGYFPYIQIQVSNYTQGALVYTLTGYTNPISINSAISQITTQFCTNCTQNGTGNITYGPFPNIGQNQHRAVFQYWNAGTCANVSEPLDAYFQGSFDGSHWFEIGSPVTSVVADKNSVSEIVMEADGQYPYVEIIFNWESSVSSCSNVNAYYTGSIRPNASDNAILPRYANRGLQTGTKCATTATTTTITTPPDASRFTVVFGWQISQQGTATAVNLQDTSANNKVTVTSNYAAAGPSAMPLFTTSRGAGLQLVTSGTNQVCINVQWRFEDNPQ